MDDESNLRVDPESTSPAPYDSDNIAGDTYSLDSSITKYRMENGRRYHAYREGAYWAPNDEKQNENLDIVHHKFLVLLDGKLLLAPISKDIERALDIGTGTGIWAIEFADKYLQTDVLGVDLSPIQPVMVPPNCRFEIDDVQDSWTYPVNFWDYIHIRSMFGSIDDWPRLYAQAYKHTKPGGYIEQLEISIDAQCEDGPLGPDDPLTKFTEVFKEAGEISGRRFQISDTMRQDIQRAGFENIVERVFKVPLNGWSEDPRMHELGKWSLLGFDSGLEGYALAPMTRILGWNSNEVLAFTAQVRNAFGDRNRHCYHHIKVVYGQKPLVPRG